MNLLFVCSKNQWRSPTAEHVAKRVFQLNARSAGTSKQAKRKISASLIEWADVICVMEEKHYEFLQDNYLEAISGKRIELLNIPDVYHYMDPELIELLTQDIESFMQKNDSIS